jgi:SAM-dependent methyltransferase
VVLESGRGGPQVNLLEWFFGNRFIYTFLRPLSLGGFDFSAVYRFLDVNSDDVVLDIGCGFGYSLEHLSEFRAYYGFDTSQRAIDALRQRFGHDPRVQAFQRVARREDFQQLKPTKVLLMGLLHHLSPVEAESLLFDLGQTESVQRVGSEDPVYRPGRWINNLLCFLDRGRYVRTREGYLDLVDRSGWQVEREMPCTSGNGLADYLCLGLSRRLVR